MSQWFSVGIYGQSGLVMDTFALNDPFTQQLPVKITNNWSGTIWVQGELIGPPTGVYASYSGVSMSGVNAGASTTTLMTWNVNVSGQTDTSSPVTHSLVLGLSVFTSSNYTGALASGSFTFSNTLFNRYSGMIKVFGDDYANNTIFPSMSVVAGGAVPTGSYYYGVTWVKSGWESDMGPAYPNNNNGVTVNGSQSVNLSWSSVTGASQYLIWRAVPVGVGVPSTDAFSYNTYSDGTINGVGNLIGISTTNSFTDSGAAPLASNIWRHCTWQGSLPNSKQTASDDTAAYLSPPDSLKLSGTTTGAILWAHTYQLNLNVSGTRLLGPVYAVIHFNYPQSGSMAFASTTSNAFISGTTITDYNVLSTQLPNKWYRHVVSLGGSGLLSTSGYVSLQILQNTTEAFNIDDVFVVATS